MSGFKNTNAKLVLASITAENMFTEPLELDSGNLASLSLSGTYVATAVLQRQLPGQVGWNDVPNPDDSVGWSDNTEKTYKADERCLLRLGVKTGDYTSGTVEARLGKG